MKDKERIIRNFLFILILISLPAICVHAGPKAKIWSEQLVIPTYEVGSAVKLPMFYDGRGYQGAQGVIYPYPWVDVLSNNKVNTSYKAVYLENDYIKLCVLPELDGRLFSALDKTNNYDYFYRQSVIKSTLIGSCGAWISGGIEWNFPHHHRASTYEMMDNVIVENADGSKTVWIGENEKRQRLRWVLGTTIYPDKSYFEVTIKIFNVSGYVTSFLYFANPSVHVDETYQVIFPPEAEYAVQHAKHEFVQWPYAKGRFGRWNYTGEDASYWRNLPTPVSFFCWDHDSDYFAGYNHGKDAGTAYIANHHIAPGKKFFTFGSGYEVKMWDRILTDSDGPYLELMAGGYSDNQPDYSWLEPYEVKTIKQYWFPIRDLQGMKFANLNGAMNLEVTADNTAKVRVNSTTVYKDAKVVLTAKGETIFEKEINISPAKPFGKDVKLKSGIRETDICLSLVASDGSELMKYQPELKPGKPMPEPVDPPGRPEDVNTIEELYYAGLRLDEFHNSRVDSLGYYMEALRRDPTDYRCNTRVGIYYLQRGQYELAGKHLKAAVEKITRNYTRPKDCEALYFLGLTMRKQGHLKEAYDYLYRATWSAASHMQAYYALAELDCIKGDFKTALEHIERSISTNTNNIKALNLRSLILRKLGRGFLAKQQADSVLKIDVLNFNAMNELYLTEKGSGSVNKAAKLLDGLKKLMRDEEQSYLDLCLNYANCGSYDEAIDVLSRVDVTKVAGGNKYPIIYYYLGYFNQQLGNGEKAAEYYKAAIEMPADYCFPFRLETIEMLKSAMLTNKNDARSPYYLGNLLYDKQPEKAIEQWEKTITIDDSYYIVHRNLGFAYSVKNNVPKAIKCYEKAIQCNNQDSAVFHELDVLYAIDGTDINKRLKMFTDNMEVVKQRDDTFYRYVVCLIQLGDYDGAIKNLMGRYFHLFTEVDSELHGAYMNAYLLRGKKYYEQGKYKEALADFLAVLEYPDNLEIETANPKRDKPLSRNYYYIATAYEALGDATKAKEFYEKSSAVNTGKTEFGYYKGMAFKKQGKDNQARAVFGRMIEVADNLDTVDFFAKFGQRSSDKAKKAEPYFLKGLAYMGMEKHDEAKKQLKKAVELDGNNVWAAFYLNQLN